MAAMAWCTSSLPQLALLTPDSSSSAIAELDHALFCEGLPSAFYTHALLGSGVKDSASVLRLYFLGFVGGAILVDVSPRRFFFPPPA